MPGSIASMAVQRRVIPPSQGPLSTRTIEIQRKKNGPERTGDGVKPNTQAKKTACSVNNTSPKICNTAIPRANSVANGPNVDERLNAARERREEQQKLIASRELSRLEREQRAKRYHEQQLQERKRKLQEQRLKEERRRAAVEEKRRQRNKEETERHESAVLRTMEKSQKAQLNFSQNPRGRKFTRNVPHRLPLTTWEKNLISRLLTPTCSYLARSKSAACESGEEVVHICRRAVSYHSTSTNTTILHKPQHHSGSVQSRTSASPSPNNSRPRSTNLAQNKTAKQPDYSKAIKKSSNSPSNTKSRAMNTSVKPAKVSKSKTASPSPERTPRRSISRHSTQLQLELPSVPEEDVSVCASALLPGNSRPFRTPAESQPEEIRNDNPPETPCSDLPDENTKSITRTAGYGSPPQTPPHHAPLPTEVTSRPLAGTTDREEASRLLAERRKEARLQREREEQERLQREEAERRSREELEHRRAEERARQQAEAQRLVEEKQRREEEEQRRAEEERAQAMKEAALLQKQREEEQAKEKAKEEQMQQEREIIAQKEDAARQARKKRLEEIMRRTRRTDSPDTNSVTARVLPNITKPKENTEPAHNGTIEDAIKLPVGTKASQLNKEEDTVPVVAFKERRSLRTLTGLEEIQTHQRAEVI